MTKQKVPMHQLGIILAVVGLAAAALPDVVVSLAGGVAVGIGGALIGKERLKFW